MKTKYIDIIKGLEGFRAVPYKCSAGVLTVGYGHSERLDDLALTNPTLTEKNATAILKKDLDNFSSVVRSSVNVPLNDDQEAALTSFCFNIGAAAFKKSTLLKKLNQGGYCSVPHEMLRWTKVQGKESIGLSKRRHAEIDLWMSYKPIHEGSVAIPEPHSDMALPHKEIALDGSTAIIGLLADKTGNSVLQWTFAVLIIIVFSYCFVMYRNKLANVW